ncbi:DUF305 domain-containing protein [Candidatus Palauibacter sp.]|uniref:DUF305 domain-containing protein n=1 Tax=Candidatus Palauibacter sp. TaxID=3101350 RepID=UPI003B58B6B6
MRTQRRLLILLTGLLAAAQACASAGRSPSDEAVRPDAARVAELEAIYRARAEAALDGAHEADIRFMTHMIPHHAQALVMAGFAPDNGASPSIRTLCARIINAQTDEIAVMSRWLSDRGLPVPETGDMRGHADGAMLMAGMLTPEQLAELEAARGPDFDRLFLEYMIQHHKGAVTMVRELFATDGAAQDDFVFKLASDIHVDQATEIARMEIMLEALAAPEPGG